MIYLHMHDKSENICNRICVICNREGSVVENQELTQIFIKYMHDIVLKAQSFKICRNVEMKKCSYEEKN